jgi:hypothetical protein
MKTGKFLFFNLLGIKVKEMTRIGPKPQLDISNLPAGTYFILISNGENRYSGKFIIMK